MAELPEITKYARQMRETLKGKTIKTIAILQEKCVNIPVDEFQIRTSGAKVKDVYHRGKWIITSLDNGEHILLSLGMGADILYFENEDKEPDKYQIKVLFTDSTGYTARFWWFGHFLLVTRFELDTESKVKDIAIDPFDEGFTLDYFEALLKGKKTQIKSFLMNQKNVSGIGNMYMHDILFQARLHPKKKISDMNEDDVKRLYNSMMEILNRSRDKGSCNYEMDFFGQEGGFGMKDLLIGYHENEPCPVCGDSIVTIKAGSSASYMCPSCQKI